jgi:hypothetical protein
MEAGQRIESRQPRPSRHTFFEEERSDRLTARPCVAAGAWRLSGPALRRELDADAARDFAGTAQRLAARLRDATAQRGTITLTSMSLCEHTNAIRFDKNALRFCENALRF